MCFHSLQTEKYLLLHLVVYSEVDIEMFSQTAARQDMIRIVNFLYKIGASFQYSLPQYSLPWVILTSWGEGVSLALVGHPSSDDVMIKMPYRVDDLHRPASHPIFSKWVG